MKAQTLHNWRVDIAEAQAIQRRLASLVSKRNEVGEVRLIAGVDVSGPNSQGIARAAVVVLSYPELAVVEVGRVEDVLNLPYVPGLLSFREAPLALAAFEKLSSTPDLVMADGQGIAHPRRLGIASHLGLLLDLPTIGCAKSILRGTHGVLDETPGSMAELVDRGEVVGAAVRTKQRSKPVYVSIGHKIDLETVVRWVLNCSRGYRIPEPTRLAHLAAGGQPGAAAQASRQRYSLQQSYL